MSNISAVMNVIISNCNYCSYSPDRYKRTEHMVAFEGYTKTNGSSTATYFAFKCCFRMFYSMQLCRYGEWIYGSLT